MSDTPTSYEPGPNVCQGCGYDLGRGKTSGRCPDCGRPISPQWRRAASQPNREASSAATVCLVLGLLSFALCPLLAPVAVIYYYAKRDDMLPHFDDGSVKGMALTGLVIGWIMTGIMLLAGLIIFIALVLIGANA